MKVVETANDNILKLYVYKFERENPRYVLAEDYIEGYTAIIDTLSKHQDIDGLEYLKLIPSIKIKAYKS